MKPLAFFREKEVLRILERGSRAAGMPLSVHFVDGSREGARVLSFGECAICHKVREVPGGVAACRASRGTASVMALRQRRSIPFVCHLGLACTTQTVLKDESFVLTLGPFCPSEESRSLEYDVTQGWNALTGERLEEPPVSLEDIHRAPSDAGPAVVEWILESVQAAWDAIRSEEESEEPDSESLLPQPPRANKATRTESHGASWTANVAAALAGGNQPRARALLKAFLEEQRGTPEQRQAGILAGLSALLETMERAGIKTTAAWEAMPAFVESVQTASDGPTLLKAAMTVLSAARREAVPKGKKGEVDSIYPTLEALARDRLVEGLSLEEAAEHLGESPSAISHRLKRRLGLSFSEYLGRLRVDKAKDMLRRTKLTATAIAHRVGVRDQSHFSKLFRKFEGMSPLEYRKQFGRKS